VLLASFPPKEKRRPAPYNLTRALSVQNAFNVPKGRRPARLPLAASEAYWIKLRLFIPIFRNLYCSILVKVGTDDEPGGYAYTLADIR